LECIRRNRWSWGEPMAIDTNGPSLCRAGGRPVQRVHGYRKPGKQGAVTPSQSGGRCSHGCSDTSIRLRPARLIPLSAEQKAEVIDLIGELIAMRRARSSSSGQPPEKGVGVSVGVSSNELVASRVTSAN